MLKPGWENGATTVITNNPVVDVDKLKSDVLSAVSQSIATAIPTT